MIATLAVLLSGSAHAGGVWLSGGLSATPTAGDVFTPSWRLGVDAGRVKPWFTMSYASFDTALFGGDVDGFALLPRIGARIDLGQPTEDREPTLFLGATATTRIMDLTLDDESWTEDAGVKGQFPFGIGLSGGLDAPVNEVLSLSAEIGGEYYHLAYVDGETLRASAVNTVAAVYVNLWF